MQIKNFILTKTPFLIIAVIGFICFGSISGCSGDSAGKPEKPEKPEVSPKENIPLSVSEIDENDLSSLRLLGGGLYFKEDKPSEWSGEIKVQYEKKQDKYVVSSIFISKNAKSPKISDLKIGGKNEIQFENLKKISVESSALGRVVIEDMKELISVEVRGMGTAEADSIRIRDNRNLKRVLIDGFPRLSALSLNGGEMDELVLCNLPSLKEFLGVKPILKKEKNEYGNYDVDLLNTIRKVNISGNMAALISIYLNGADMEYLTLDKKGMPSLEILSISENKLTGSLDLSEMVSLSKLFLRSSSISSIDLSGCMALKYADISNNKQLKTMNLGDSQVLSILSLDRLNYPTMNISKFKALKSFSAYSSEITDLVLADSEGNGPSPDMFGAYENKLREFVYPAQIVKKMTILNIRNNDLERVDISAMYKNLETFDMSHNVVSELILPEDETNRYESYDQYDISDNHLPLSSVVKLYILCDRPRSKFNTGPQFEFSGQDSEKKEVDYSRYSEYLEEGNCSLCVAKLNASGKRWISLKEGSDYVRGENKINLSHAPAGKYRVGLKGKYGTAFAGFTLQKPYVLGEISIN